MTKRFITLMAAAAVTAGASFAAGQTPEDQYAAYLFTYFTGNHIDDEAICYAVSNDGYNFRALNGGKPVMDSKIVSSTGGMRDPHILRGQQDSVFYMVATDMVSANGWDSNRAMVLMKSYDLINWDTNVVNMQKKYKGQERLKRVWAPQTIFDPEAQKYMVYWSMKHGDGPDIIYYAYATPDFSDLEGEPKVLFEPEDKKSCIDGDIVLKDGTFYMFYKTEGHGNGIKVAKTKSLTSGKWEEDPEYKQQTKDAVEGAGTFKLIGQDKYILMYDVYIAGKYQFTVTEDFKNFKVVDNDVTMDFHPRHGTVIPITAQELRNLTEKYGTPEGITVYANPILPGYHADPEILWDPISQKYYIYSTTDGVPHWGGTKYSAFSSPDLKHWTDEGVVLDVASDQVAWADGNLWAPAAERRLIGNKNKYFLYYSAKPVGKEAKEIGVAVADSPVGPFVDLGHSIISSSPTGRGQQIDVDVFVDPISDKPYVYWGNGYMAGAELKPNMTEVKAKTIKVLTPEGGTLKDYAYREAPYVFYRDGLYYFMWSVDDTGSPNYHVAYGTSKSPLGPITVAPDPIVLIQDPEKEIYGPAHNSVVKDPKSDDWYIVYHRINKHHLNDGPGYHRQTCIDRLEFNPDGTIKRVTPTK
ncbi:MAG: family 43 glycosylhydrolase [Clostridium sp.]|nr:family 43 glycosylhydrolase [Clostridium sp.]